MATITDNMRLTKDEEIELAKIKDDAKIRHEKARKAAKARGRIDFPLLPIECSWAYEMTFLALRNQRAQTKRDEMSKAHARLMFTGRL